MKWRLQATNRITCVGRFFRGDGVRLITIAVLSTAIGCSSTNIASAQQRGTDAQQADCMPDVFRLCPGEILDEAAILACLQTKATRLSPACHRVIEPGPQARG